MSKFAKLGIALETEKPFRLILRNTKGDGQPIRDRQGVSAYVDVLSTDSRLNNELQRPSIDKKLTGVKPSADSIRADGNERLARLTAGWRLVSFTTREPVDLPFSYETALEVYADPSMDWLRDQVAEAAADRANFTPAPPTDSKPSHGTSRENPSSEPKPEEPQTS